MKNIINTAVAAIVLVLISVGCRTAPIYNVNESLLTSSENQNINNIEKVIISSGTSLGWIMKSTGKGHIVATLILRTHVAKVDITFNTKTFSIKYQSSQNLNYDADSNIIHTNYNGWVQNLEKNITARLSAL